MPLAQTFEPYYPAHVERNTYITLLARDPPAPDAVLKAALVRRAVADVTRALKIREDKPSLQNLLQKGAIGDDLWNSFLAAEKELEVEIVEVMREAESFLPQWGQLIFQTANEVIASDKMRATLEGMQAHTASLGAFRNFLYIMLFIITQRRNMVYPQEFVSVLDLHHQAQNRWAPSALLERLVPNSRSR